MTGPTDDPLAAWRKLLSTLETSVNAVSNDVMKTEQFSKSMNQFASLSAGAQHFMSNSMERYLSMLNMPTGNQLKDIAARLATIEGRLAELTGQLRKVGYVERVSATAAITRPPRTRSPSTDESP